MPKLSNSNSGGDVNTEYTDEQHLIAAVNEYRKLETANQDSLDRMYNALQSPLKFTEKPCEAPRLQVVRCYETLRDAEAQRQQQAAEGAAAAAAAPSASSSQLPFEELLPLQECHGLARDYWRCVNEKVLARHVANAADFEARHAPRIPPTETPSAAPIH